MDLVEEQYLNGPDQVITDQKGQNLTTTEPDGYVKIREYEGDCRDEYPFLSVPSLLRNAAKRYTDKTALSVKRNNVWVKWTFNEYYEQSGIAALAFIKLGLQRNQTLRAIPMPRRINNVMASIRQVFSLPDELFSLLPTLRE